MISQRPQTLAQAVEIACSSEEVLNEQFGLLQKKDKNKGASSSGNNNNNNGKGANQTQSTPKLRMQLGKGRLRAINRMVGTDQFVRNATVVTEGNVGATNRSATSVDSWDIIRRIAR